MFSFDTVSKSFGALRAIAGVSLEISPGRTTVLIGPSGCGKSTLLRLMAGLATPDDGSIRFDGEPLNAATIGSIRRRIGYVTQQGGLFPHLTARRNVCIMAEHLRWQPDRTEQRLGELCGLTHFPADALERYPQELSGGQNQRVSLMRALLLDPPVLLLDEPLGALDPMIRHELQDELKDLFDRLGKTVIMVTHDLAEAAYLGQRIVLMRAGEIIQTGTARDLMSAPANEFVARFTSAQRSRLEAGGSAP